MKLKFIITGTVVTAILLVVLAATRLMKTEVPQHDMLLHEVDVVHLSAPPEPPMEESEPEVKPQESLEIPQESVPVLTLDLAVSEQAQVPHSAPSIQPRLAVDVMALDRAPASLPAPVVTKTKTTGNKPSRPSSPRRTARPRVKPAPVKKAFYRPGELDGRPRQLRVGRFTWPHGARGRSGTVMLELEIDTRGRVRVVRVISTSDPKLSAAAMKVARGSRFSAPKKNGVAVKARYTKTYKLKKP